MNSKQKMVVVLGALALVAMGLYPPYLKQVGFVTGDYAISSIEYGPIFNPPSAGGGAAEWSNLELAVPQLVLQVFVVLVVAGAGYLLSKE